MCENKILLITIGKKSSCKLLVNEFVDVPSKIISRFYYYSQL